ncbi:hypothetical protein [Poriferisphaera corsica]|uniref:hypothetical protein n=1 Tax=Poriferisphaera corsica TaxID=2528020 RepID=UPI0011A5BD03|nr:hypothetical protein [Poriferisphaera corsica]
MSKQLAVMAAIPLIVLCAIWSVHIIYLDLIPKEKKQPLKQITEAKKPLKSARYLTSKEILTKLENKEFDATLYSEITRRHQYQQISEDLVDFAKENLIQQIENLPYNNGSLSSISSPEIRTLVDLCQYDTLDVQHAVDLARRLYGNPLRIRLEERMFKEDSKYVFILLFDIDHIINITGLDSLVWVRQMWIDGNEINIDESVSPDIIFNEIHLTTNHDLKPGKHTLKILFEQAFVNDILDRNTKYWRKNWPKKTVSYQIETKKFDFIVYKNERQAIKRVVNKEFQNWLDTKVNLRYCQIRYRQGKRFLQIGFNSDLSHYLNSMPYELGVHIRPHKAQQSTTGIVDDITMPLIYSLSSGSHLELSIPDSWDFESVDIVLIDEAETIKKDLSIEQIPSGRREFKNIPVLRLDHLHSQTNRPQQ